MAAENRFCAECVKRTPTLYCPCSGSRISLCDECVECHMEKYPQLRHMTINISAADSAAYIREMERFAAGKTELEQVLTKIDQCCYELTEAVNFVVNKLISYRDECVGQLQGWKVSLSSEIAEAVGEVQAALLDGELELRSKYSHSLRHFKPGDFDSLSSLVDSELRHSREVLRSWERLHQHLTQFRSREACRAKEGEARKAAPTDPPLIVHVDEDAGVCVFTHAEDCLPEKRQLYQFGGEWDVDKPLINGSSSYTLLDAERLISCGFDSYYYWSTLHTNSSRTFHPTPRASSFIVFLNEATKFARLPNMNHERMSPGIVKHGDYAYVFGDAYCDAASHTSGEYLAVSAGRSWTLASGAMSAQRYSFTPCVMGNSIYLCGGPESDTIDLFDIERKAFDSPAAVQLPEASGCIAFMRGSAELVVISKTKVSVFPLLGDTLQQGEAKDHRELDIWPNSTPVVFLGNSLSVYFTCYGSGRGKCVRLVLEPDSSVRAIDEVSE